MTAAEWFNQQEREEHDNESEIRISEIRAICEWLKAVEASKVRVCVSR